MRKINYSRKYFAKKNPASLTVLPISNTLFEDVEPANVPRNFNIDELEAGSLIETDQTTIQNVLGSVLGQ